MSTIPKGYKDNYSNNNKKIDKNGNQKPHPRLTKKVTRPKRKQSMKEYAAELVKGGATTRDTTNTKPKAVKPVFSKVKEAVGKGIETARRSVDYDPKDRKTYKKRW